MRAVENVVVLSLCISLSGCGAAYSDSDVTEFDTLFRLIGTVATSGVDRKTMVHVALIWKDGDQFKIGSETQALYEDNSTRSFDLRITRRPPESTYQDTSDAVALGGLVFYRDVNDNGRLDRVQTGHSTSPDRLLGVSHQIGLRYAKSEAPTGFSLRRFTSDCFPQLDCQGEVVPGTPGKFGRPKITGLAFELDSDLVLGGCAAGETISQYGTCYQIRKMLQTPPRDSCPSKDPLCKEPGTSQSAIVFEPQHQQLLDEVKTNACCPVPEGAQVWKCNPVLGCPAGFKCDRHLCSPGKPQTSIPRWVMIPSGTFSIGSSMSDPCRDIEAPPHPVELTRKYWMATSEVTQAEFLSVMGFNPATFSAAGSGANKDCPSCPVESVSWDEATGYCNELSLLNEVTPCYKCQGEGPTYYCTPQGEYSGAKIVNCPGYRLPTEAEWEHAYRAGATTAFYNGPITSCDGPDALADKIAWYSPHGTKLLKRPQPVRAKLPNKWGLYDMAGNVQEWTLDWYQPWPIQPRNPPVVVDPVNLDTGTIPTGHVIRGGDYSLTPSWIRSSARLSFDRAVSVVGFRCIRPI
jgi:formylglycine-generating enzyme required for sulfatase activity